MPVGSLVSDSLQIRETEFNETVGFCSNAHAGPICRKRDAGKGLSNLNPLPCLLSRLEVVAAKLYVEYLVKISRYLKRVFWLNVKGRKRHIIRPVAL